MSYLDQLLTLETSSDFENAPKSGTDKTDETPGPVGSVSFGSSPTGPFWNFDGATLAELRAAAGEDWPEIKNRPEALEALATALKTRAMRERGERPPHYTQATRCAGCGPVWLWEGAPGYVLGCPWCFNRQTGTAIPRPPDTT